MNEKISVIVPIYNVEKYLNRCIDSIVNQTYRNLEIILVDDGSPDNCPLMCDKWKKKDSRIKVIHKENGGLSDARNAGIKTATGSFISFIDSDDYIDIHMYDHMMKLMIEYGADIVDAGVQKIWEDKEENEVLKNKASIKIYNNEEALKLLIKDSEMKQTVWNKLYRYETIKMLLFPVGKLNEDEFWTYQAFGNANIIVRTQEIVYYYVQRRGSIMGEGYSLRRLDALEGKIERQQYLVNYFPELVQIGNYNLYISCMYAMQMSLKFLNSKDKAAAVKKIELIFNNIVMQSNTLNFNDQIWFFMAKKNLFFTCEIRNYLKIGF